MLRHYYGYDYAAIAAFLGTTSGTVGSILSRAHAALRLRLEREPAAMARGAEPPTPMPNATRPTVERTADPPEVLP